MDNVIPGLMASKSQFLRGSSTVRKITQINNDLDEESEKGSSINLATYTVHIPPTPDNQPMEISMERSTSRRVEEQYASSSMFTGGFNQVTRAQLKEKVIESEWSHPQMAGAKGSPCAVPGCDGRVMTDERGLNILPCECGYMICGDCYRDALRTGDGICPGCKEPYKELPDTSTEAVMHLSSSAAISKMERRLSSMKSKSGALVSSQINEVDHNQWLYETKGSYGYGNAMWPKDSENDSSSEWMAGDPKVFQEKQWRPLTRKSSISAAVLSPYRYSETSSIPSYFLPVFKSFG